MTTIREVIEHNSVIILAEADKELLKEIQTKLKLLGYYTVPVDGIYGIKTAAAWGSFKKDYMQANWNIVGAGSLEVLERLVKALPVGLDSELAKYQDLYKKAIVDTDKTNQINTAINLYVNNISKYNLVSNTTKVPSHIIFCIHYREATCDFKTHLHNGDSLAKRTKNEPKGRPVKGEPPYSWTESAIDAIQYDGLDKVTDWSIPSALKRLEGYNGLGYKMKGLLSPYLWAGTSLYNGGKYTSDGHYNPDAIDAQLGCVVLIKRLEQLSLIGAQYGLK